MRADVERIVFQEKLLAALPPLAPPERRRLRVQQGPGSGPIQKVLGLPESIEALFRDLGELLQGYAYRFRPLNYFRGFKGLVCLNYIRKRGQHPRQYRI